LLIEESYKNAYETYQKLLKLGIAREMARIVLPVGEYTQFYWTSNIRSIMHFLNLRADGHAQYEIQLYAKAIAEIFSKVCPLSYTAFLKYSYTGNILKEV
jgi:thymidylate synthase (FAD)